MANILRNRCAKFFVWAVAEILLTFLGVDDLADCGEYVFECQLSSSISASSIMIYQ